MLLFHRPVPAKIPKRRSRAGCIHCKEKKKKCNEDKPQCDRCQERGLLCAYEPVKPRKRRRTMSAVESSQSRPHVTSDPNHPPPPHVQFQSQHSQQNGFSNVFMNARQSSSSASPVIDGWDDSGLSAGGSSASSCGDMLDDGSLPPLDPFEGHLPTCTADDIFAPIAARSKSAFPDLPTLAPAPNSSPLQPSPLQSSSPSFVEFTPKKSRQTLLSHFARVLSHLLVFRDDPENPFTHFILPMALRSQVVLNAILALSTAHMEHRGLENEERSLDLHSKAISGLSNLIAGGDKTNRDEVLAVIMLLVYYEVVRGGSSAILHSHLKGALSIMKARHLGQSPTGLFLEKAYRYFDVICALSFGTTPFSGSVPPQPKEGVSLDLNAISAVDNLFGLMTDLWPLVHRIATLLEKKTQIDSEAHMNPDKANAMRADLEANTSNIALALYQWQPKLPGSLLVTDVSADDSKVQSIISNAEAYRQACLVYLFRTIHCHPRKSPKVQTHTKHALQACLRVIIFTGPMSTLLWPLFTAACEAIEDVDKNVARTVFQHLESRQGMQNIVFASHVAEEVWRRQDLGQEVDWRQVANERGLSTVLG